MSAFVFGQLAADQGRGGVAIQAGGGRVDGVVSVLRVRRRFAGIAISSRAPTTGTRTYSASVAVAVQPK